LPQGQIINNLNCEIKPPKLDLYVYYRMNQGFDKTNNILKTILIDSSGNNKNGVLNNFALIDSISNWKGVSGINTTISCVNTNVWLGNSSLWDDANNWSGNYIPYNETNVEIMNNSNFMPIISKPNSICYSLKIGNGASINIIGNGKLEIVGKK
jgi:hypothetical protein